MHANPQPEALLLSERDAAALLGISPRTLWSLRKAGKVRFVEVSPRCVRYARTALVAWVAEQSEPKGGAQ